MSITKKELYSLNASIARQIAIDCMKKYQNGRHLTIEEKYNRTTISCERYECKLVVTLTHNIKVYIKLNTLNYIGTNGTSFMLYSSDDEIQDIAKYKSQLSKWLQFTITQALLIPYSTEYRDIGYECNWEVILMKSVQLDTDDMEKWIEKCFYGMPSFRWSGAKERDIINDIKANYNMYIHDEAIMNDEECLECIRLAEDEMKEETVKQLYKALPLKLKKQYNKLDISTLDEEIRILTMFKERKSEEDIMKIMQQS